jgi:hypothetical protein
MLAIRAGNGSALWLFGSGFTLAALPAVSLFKTVGIPCSFHELLTQDSFAVQPFPIPTYDTRCRVGGGASWRLASVRRSNPACSFPALGFHQSAPSAALPTEHPWIPMVGAGLIQSSSFLGGGLLGFSQKELIHDSLFTHWRLSSPQPLWPVAFPSPRGCLRRGHAAFTALLVLFDRPTTRQASLPISLRAYRVAYPVPRNLTSPPGVTHPSSLPCRPHTPWYDGWMRTPSPP